MTEESRQRLASEYVLGLLEAEENRQCDRLMAEDREFAAMVEAWRDRLRELDETAAPAEADAGLWQRIASGLESSPRLHATATPAAETRSVRRSFSDFWDSLVLWRGIGMAATAIALVLAVSAPWLSSDAQRPSSVAILMGEGDRPAAIVNAFADGRIELVPIQTIDVPEGKSLQVWTLWNRSLGPVSIGLLDRMRGTDLSVGGLPAPTENQLYEITLEPEGGSPIGRPTGPILMKGNITGAL
ncbi:anti-sigma-K factor RskA [Rhodoligotrophos appendicifer]|uniref:anti-sigma factor n=1 Tax=Rhodoligotrophos appendicifer TaxID=987056 RepID=UPI001180834C|nr:anti-sigma factor [Rhodoligotrophos appendicifer]